MTAVRPLPGSELCVHCGFCLQACPTYLTLDDENDSPRGRIVLMKALAAGTLDPADDAVGLHLDQCLGCRACETACPSGVPYGHLLEDTRAALAAHRPGTWIERLVLFTFANPAPMWVAMWFARMARAVGLSRVLLRAPGRLGVAMATLEATRRPQGSPTTANHSAPAASTPVRENVAVLTGCVMEGLLAPVNRATERVLAYNGYQLRAAPTQRCCGALHAHAGDRDTARLLARANIEAFDVSDAQYIAVNSAGCGAAMKDYAHLLADDAAWRDRATAFSARVRDVSELLAAAGPHPAQTATPGRVAVDHPCHLVHGQRLSSAPAKVLGAVHGLDSDELPDAAQCCGSAGLYSLAQPDLSRQILSPKIDGIVASGARTVVTGNPGCMMHIGAGLLRAGSDVAVRHPVELLDAAYTAQRAAPSAAIEVSR
ncbi:MAG: heterodisulfide reductase-related iron-sulfur binding cluster [Gemmatimonadetes bacterium]|nr:heterodisulfide reductase-related iron-sulfur binding cluster [Gemmatimonadota bacterium]